MLAPPRLTVGRVLLLGLGKAASLDAAALQGFGGTLVAQLNSVGESTAAVALDKIDGMKLKPAEAAANLGYGARLRDYRFDKYRTKEKPEQKPSLKTFTIMSRDAAGARRAFAPLEKIAEGVFFTRDLVSEPANIIYPETLAAAARSLTKLGVVVEVLDERQMKKLGMGALLGVGQGSARAAASRRHAVEGRLQGQERAAGRLHRQGRDLRHRRHLDQAGRRHGGHEVGHGRRRRGHRPDARARRAQGQGQRGGRHRPGREHARRAPRSARATSSPRCPARPSRC